MSAIILTTEKCETPSLQLYIVCFVQFWMVLGKFHNSSLLLLWWQRHYAAFPLIVPWVKLCWIIRRNIFAIENIHWKWSYEERKSVHTAGPVPHKVLQLYSYEQVAVSRVTTRTDTASCDTSCEFYTRNRNISVIILFLECLSLFSIEYNHSVSQCT